MRNDMQVTASESALVLQLSQGQSVAFEALFRIYYSRLYRFAYSLLRSAEDAEEILQDVFIQVWEKRQQLDPESSFSSYLFTCTKHKALNVIRHRVYERQYQSQSSANAISTDTEEQIYFQELQEATQNAVDALHPQRKRIFKMSREEGLTYREIAQALGISQKTVENHLGLALKDLRRSLKEHVIPLLFLLSFLFI
ncbi:RNA polymerase sigma-70 factor [Tunicatimonas pelagia]|uniref:RNA polymerase sigma-70 factor n=1 Tax=Tunicatimonas pelagia TaxID=931531 RepID=UPI002666288E|nr:RNA polymerase sigma-70 factor [Tunicatimonas pelagia]WKN42109.1 RNA polymerase sigma-70 factor [Tunicatimonas pelagia]